MLKKILFDEIAVKFWFLFCENGDEINRGQNKEKNDKEKYEQKNILMQGKTRL